MVKLPDEDEHRRRWAALPVGERRQVMRAINRGVALDNKQHAVLAVRLARKQQRFWSRAWIVGPLVSLLFLTQGIASFLANAALATLILGVMSWFWYRRAARAAQANLEVLGLAPDDGRTSPASGPDDGPSDVPDRAGTPHAANPPKRSRRKRRG